MDIDVVRECPQTPTGSASENMLSPNDEDVDSPEVQGLSGEEPAKSFQQLIIDDGLDSPDPAAVTADTPEGDEVREVDHRTICRFCSVDSDTSDTSQDDWQSANEDNSPTCSEDTPDKLKWRVPSCLKPKTVGDESELPKLLPKETASSDVSDSDEDKQPTDTKSSSQEPPHHHRDIIISKENSSTSDMKPSSSHGSQEPMARTPRYTKNPEYQGQRILKKYPEELRGNNSATDAAAVVVRRHLKPDPFAEDEADFSYNMQNKRRGIFVIINNRKFSMKGVEERTGTDVDADKLERTFSRLGFEIWRCDNQSIKNMMDIMHKVAKENHKDADCFGCAILSHGDEGIIYGTNSIIEIDLLLQPVKDCVTLRGKPKLFFIQACRGCKMDDGVDMIDGPPGDKTQRIPKQADCLYAFSTTPGYFSWRNKLKGSWFVQSLCNILDIYGKTKEIMWLLTRVNRCVAHKFESRASDAALDMKKQMPSIVSQLTKQVFFSQKVLGLAERQAVVEISRLVPSLVPSDSKRYTCTTTVPISSPVQQTKMRQAETSTLSSSIHSQIPTNGHLNNVVYGMPIKATSLWRQSPQAEVCLAYSPGQVGTRSLAGHPQLER